MNATRVNLCICGRMHWRGAHWEHSEWEVWQQPRQSFQPSHRAPGRCWAGPATWAELSRTSSASGTRGLLFQTTSSAPGAQGSQRTLVQPCKNTSTGTLHHGKANGALPSPPRALHHSWHALVPTEPLHFGTESLENKNGKSWTLTRRKSLDYWHVAPNEVELVYRHNSQLRAATKGNFFTAKMEIFLKKIHR